MTEESRTFVIKIPDGEPACETLGHLIEAIIAIATEVEIRELAKGEEPPKG